MQKEEILEYRKHKQGYIVKEQKAYLLPETSMSFMAKAIQGSINKVVRALIRNDADSEPMPISERRISTPASSRI